MKPKKRASLQGKKVPVVLICTDVEDREVYRVEPEMICLQGFVEIVQDHTDLEIKELLVKVFQKKYPKISIYDFDYVKREKNNISIPTVDDSFKWNFEGIKVLIGQEKLICCLNTTETSLFAAVVGNSSENSQIITISDHEEYHIEHPNEKIISETGDQNEILESSSNQPVLANVNSTNASSIQIGLREAELEELVHDLLTEQDSSTGIFQSLQDALKYLKSKMSDESEKLKVDEEDVLSDGMHSHISRIQVLTFISLY